VTICNCQFAPYNSYYEGLPGGLAGNWVGSRNLAQEAPEASGGVTSWPLQCASNKWKQPAELAKLELPHVDEDSSKSSTDDAAMQTPILLPASEFQILFVPFVGEGSREKD
jgi:TBCC domain-containing protein 1